MSRILEDEGGIAAFPACLFLWQIFDKHVASTEGTQSGDSPQQDDLPESDRPTGGTNSPELTLKEMRSRAAVPF
jgi:hypothetical protein